MKSKQVIARRDAKRAPRRKKEPVTLPPFQEPLRYPIPIASGYLHQSDAKTWRQIAEGTIKAIKDEGRTYISGSEIVRRCNPAQ